MSVTLFISDLHLDPERPAITGLFLDFLGNRARGADALYILGDLFEAWVGDDDISGMNREVCTAIQACARSAFRIFPAKSVTSFADSNCANSNKTGNQRPGS